MISLGTLILTLVVIGVVMWAVNTYIPMEPGIKRVLNIAVIVVIVIWLLRALGVLAYLDVPVIR